MTDLTELVLENIIAEDCNIHDYALKCEGCKNYFAVITQLDVVTLQEKVLLQSAHMFESEKEVLEVIKNVRKIIKQKIEN